MNQSQLLCLACFAAIMFVVVTLPDVVRYFVGGIEE